MKKTWFVLMMGLVVLAACGGTQTAEEEAPEAEAPAEEAAAETTAVTDASALVGGTWFSGAREGVYLQFNDDGTWMGAFDKERLPDAPDIQGVYRFEDDQLIIEDTGYSDLVTGRCLEVIGTYSGEIRENGRLYFEDLDDTCENRGRSLSSVLGHVRLDE